MKYAGIGTTKDTKVAQKAHAIRSFVSLLCLQKLL